MTYKLMGIEKTPGKSGMMLKIIGRKNGIVIAKTMTLLDNKLTTPVLRGIICTLMKIDPGDIQIPEHIKIVIEKEE